jgi:hypothetical protein
MSKDYHYYYHGIKDQTGNASGIGFLLLVPIAIAVICLIFAYPVAAFSLILGCVMMGIISSNHDCAPGIIKSWALGYLCIYLFGVYNHPMNPQALHGWCKIGYYTLITLLSVGSTFGVDYFVRTYLRQYYEYLSFIPLIATYAINYHQSNRLVMGIVMFIWSIIEGIGKAVG